MEFKSFGIFFFNQMGEKCDKKHEVVFKNIFVMIKTNG